MKRHSPACERNRDPILGQLRRWLGSSGLLLEVASGTGQHAAWCAPRLDGVTWQPSDQDQASLDSIDAWARDTDCGRILPAIRLDVTQMPWPVDRADAVFCANMVHIAPWACARSLVSGAGAALKAGGVLMLYGPFRVAGSHTAPSNEAFDQDLQARDPRWGVRDLEDIGAMAQHAGLDHLDTSPMPANNLFVVWRKRT